MKFSKNIFFWSRPTHSAIHCLFVCMSGIFFLLNIEWTSTYLWKSQRSWLKAYSDFIRNYSNIEIWGNLNPILQSILLHSKYGNSLMATIQYYPQFLKILRFKHFLFILKEKGFKIRTFQIFWRWKYNQNIAIIWNDITIKWK